MLLPEQCWCQTAEQTVLEFICNNFSKDVLAQKLGTISFWNTETLSENIISICTK